MQLVIDGLKIQPCSPTFVEARNALITADEATTGGQDYCMIWEVFANRGLGVNASSGNRNSSQDQIQDFTTPPQGPNCTLSVDYFANQDMFKIYPNPSNGQFTVQVNQFTGFLKIIVIDNNGRLVYEEDNANFDNDKIIDISTLQSGFYIVKVVSDQFNFSKKIIKN